MGKRRPLRRITSTLSPDWEETLLNLMKRDSWYYSWSFAWEYKGLDNGIEHEGPERIRQIMEKGENRLCLKRNGN
jgi:hypothetical protein